MIRWAGMPLALIAAPALADVAAVNPPPMTAPAPVDPAKLALSRTIVLKIMPPGRMREVMNASMGMMTQKMLGEMKNLPLAPILEASGMSAEQATKINMGDLLQALAIIDPAYEQRQQIRTKIAVDAMAEVMESIAPDMREAMAQAYARNFDATELQDIKRFFDTPSGEAYAARATMLMSDPGVRDAALKMMPKIAEMLPDMIKTTDAATASLPKPRTLNSLTDAERSRLAQLLGIDPAQLKKRAAAAKK